LNDSGRLTCISFRRLKPKLTVIFLKLKLESNDQAATIANINQREYNLSLVAARKCYSTSQQTD